MAATTGYEKDIDDLLKILKKLPVEVQASIVEELITRLREEKSAAEVPASGVTLREFHEMLRTAPPLTDEEAEEFARDVGWIRAQMNALPLRDPWQS